MAKNNGYKIMSLKLREITITTPNGITLIQNRSLTIQSGEISVLMGASGSGKSTLLNAIAGHLSPLFNLQGSIELNAVELTTKPAEARQIGLVFQDAMLFPHLSLGDNLAFGLAPAYKARRRREKVDQALEQAGLGGLYNRHPDSLSGGQRSRAALMRALLAEPSALLLDEPFASLDENRRADIRAFTLTHIQQRKIPVLLVTHDPEDAAAMGDQVESL
jgi:putative thiamine transport system ATP-binding protein